MLTIIAIILFVSMAYAVCPVCHTECEYSPDGPCTCDPTLTLESPMTNSVLHTELTQATITTFEFDGKWHADVHYGDHVWTTEACDDEECARWVAQDWCNYQLAKLS